MNPIQPVYNFVVAHPFLTLFSCWIFNNFVLYMPPPDAQSGKPYKWAFGVLHGMAGAIPRVASNFLPKDSWIYKLLAGGNGTVNGADPAAAPKT